MNCPVCSIEDNPMKRLHYLLGFPTYRSGGMIKFCMDIMLEQVRLGHEVSRLWSGQMKMIKRYLYSTNRITRWINNLEVINPLPI